MSASISAKSRMERILRLQEQIDEIKLDIRQVYAEEKADGGDKTAMGAAISYIRKRAKDKDVFDEREALAAVYVNAFEASGTGLATHTHEADAKLIETIVKGVQTETGRKALVTALDVMIDAETGEITEHEQPETATQSSDGERPVAVAGSEHHSTDHVSPPASQAAMGGGSANTENDNVDGGAARAGYGGQPLPLAGQIETRTKAEIVDENASLAAREGEKPLHSHSNPQPSPLSGADKPEAVSPPAVSGAISDDDVPAFIKRDYVLRPHCLNPSLCAGSGREHCHRCKRAMAESEAA